jgi:tRNA(Ile2) C34 agmatinyltransferase TiaS
MITRIASYFYKKCPDCGEPLEETASTFRKYFKCKNCGYHLSQSNRKPKFSSLQFSYFKILAVFLGVLLGIWFLIELLN